MTRYMKDAGYATGHFGKYINGRARSLVVPPHWDRWCETLGDGVDGADNSEIPDRANMDGTLTNILHIQLFGVVRPEVR